MIEYTVRVEDDGDRVWLLNGNFHRVDGPAVEYATGGRFWYLNGKFHRVDGPAVEFADGYREWWLNGKKYSEQEFLAKTAPKKELTVAEIEKALGYSIKIVKG